MNKRLSLLARLSGFLFGAAALSLPLFAKAQTAVDIILPPVGLATRASESFSINNIGFGVVQYIAYFVSYLISVIGYTVFTIEVFFLQFLIDLNFTIVNSLSVQFGFSIVLAFANILFVAAVIIMAVATIVRYDTYGAKQILWKIVIAAIGVNFSLILAGTVINFSDQITKYFLTASITQNPASNEFASSGFVDNLAGAFSPQKMMIASGVAPSNNTAALVKKTAESIFSSAGGMFAAIAGVMMTAAMVVLLTIFFGILVAAFLARFIMLSLLLVIMPAVWLAWIFPFGKGLVSFWRDKFVKYTFFAPVAMFFLYLSMKSAAFINSAHIIGNAGIQDLATTPPGDNRGIAAYLVNTFGTRLVQPLISNYLNFALIAGTLYGGLYFSSKMGIKAAAAGEAAFRSVGNSVKRQTIGRASTYAKNRAKTAAKNSATRTLDRIRTAGKDEKGVSWLQRKGGEITSAVGKDKPLGKILAKVPGATTIVGKTVRKAGGTIAAVGVANKETVDARVKYEAESGNFKALPTVALQDELRQYTSGHYAQNDDAVVAILGELKSRKELVGVAKSSSPVVEEKMKAYTKKLDDDAKKADEEGKPKISKKERKKLEKAKKKEIIAEHKDEEEAFQEGKKKLFKRLKEDGKIKDIMTGAPPALAKVLPLEKTKDKSRDMTEAESEAALIGGVKKEDIAVIANDEELFEHDAEFDASNDPHAPGLAPDERRKRMEERAEQARPSMVRTIEIKPGQLKEIGELNIDTAAKIAKTVDYGEYILKAPEEKGITPEEKKLREEERDLYFYDPTSDDFQKMTAEKQAEHTKDKITLTAARARYDGLKTAVKKSINLVTRIDEIKEREKEEEAAAKDAKAVAAAESKTAGKKPRGVKASSPVKEARRRAPRMGRRGRSARASTGPATARVSAKLDTTTPPKPPTT